MKDGKLLNGGLDAGENKKGWRAEMKGKVKMAVDVLQVYYFSIKDKRYGN